MSPLQRSDTLQRSGPLAAVVLAAGKSTRLPCFKPLLRLGGQSLLARAAHLFRQAGVAEILVVTGCRADEVAGECLALGLRPVHNPDFEAGMFSSVRAGLAALPAGCAGAFVLPVDIPLVRPATLSALAGGFRQSTAQALIPAFGGAPGHPPVIAASAVPRILAWAGQGGSGGLAGALAALDCEPLPVADTQILFDVDDDAALAQAEARLDLLDRASTQEALALLEIHKAGARGLAHGRGVANVALALAQALNRRGAGLDLELLEAAALVHDIAKGQPQHEQAGARLLADLGFTRTAEIVAAHRDIDPAGLKRPTERELVYLADKLVRGPQRVDIGRRFQEKLDRFAHDAEATAAIRRRLGHALEMQKLVEDCAGHGLEELLRALPEPLPEPLPCSPGQG